MVIQRVALGSVTEKVDYGLTASATEHDTGVKFLRITDIQDDIVDWRTVPYCTCPFKEAQKHRLEKGDIVFARTGATTGKSYLINEFPEGAVFASYLIRVRPKRDAMDPIFLSYFFRTSDYWRQISGSAVGAAQLGFNATKLKGLIVPLPPLSEQQRIAAVLTKADRLRRLRRYALELSDSYLQSVFLEMFGDPVTNPMGWEIKAMGTQIKSIRYGTSSPPAYHKGGIPFIRATNIKGGTVQQSGLVHILEDAARGLPKCQVRAGDLVIVRSGVNTGDCAVIPVEFDGAYAAYDLIVEVEYPKNYYYNFLINSPHGKSIIGPLSRRAGQQHINAEQVRALSFPVPPLPLQQQFARVVHKFGRLRAQQREAQRQTEHLFQTLLHRAFQGELAKT